MIAKQFKQCAIRAIGSTITHIHYTWYTYGQWTCKLFTGNNELFMTYLNNSTPKTMNYFGKHKNKLFTTGNNELFLGYLNNSVPKELFPLKKIKM